MILRTWRGAVRHEQLDEYLEHQDQTGIREYRQTPGNVGVLVTTREADGLVEVTTWSLWESMDAVRAFAGDDPEVARFYPGDDDLLAQKDLHATHHTVAGLDLAADLVRGEGS